MEKYKKTSFLSWRRYLEGMVGALRARPLLRASSASSTSTSRGQLAENLWLRMLLGVRGKCGFCGFVTGSIPVGFEYKCTDK